MKISFYTLGCKVNQYETQALKEQFIKQGYEIAGEEEYADVYVVNTCTVTGLSDRKSRQFIRRAKRLNPDCITAVIGCYAQRKPEEAAEIEGVNIVLGTSGKTKLPEYVKEALAAKDKKEDAGVFGQVFERNKLTDYEETGTVTEMEERTRAFIKVQEGCDRFCSYCVIPYVRGPARSRSLDEIVKEAETLIAGGCNELVLTGINTALYGTEEGYSTTKGEGARQGLYGIENVIAALNSLKGDFRIRLSSLEPTVVNEDYVKGLLKYEKLCPHLHLSLQSGSDNVLRRMNRRYDREQYLKIVKVLREHDPSFGITTDIIVGFPGETEEDFRESLDMVEKVKFAKVHVFPYSKRDFTKAADMPDQVDGRLKKCRAGALIEVSEKAAEDFFNRCIGEERVVLFEKYNEKTKLWEGYSDNYIRVYNDGTGKEDYLGRFLTAKLDGLYQDGMSCHIDK